MSVSVVVPRAGDCAHRERAWEWVRQQYEGLEVVEGSGDPEAWCKADAVADGLSRASGDLLVIADADVWSEDLSVAIDSVIDGDAAWAIPHLRVRRLTEASTSSAFAGARVDGLPLERAPYRGVVGGGIVVLARELYDRVPLDPRFVGWGGEDQAWGYALRTLAGEPLRSGGTLWHCWHPPQQERPRLGSDANKKLRARYAAANRKPVRMRSIIEEVTAWRTRT